MAKMPLTITVFTAIIPPMHGQRKTKYRRLWSTLSRSLGWFVPGLGVKRWMIVLLAGVTLIGVGLALLLLDVYRTAPETWWLPVVSFLSLKFLTRPFRVAIFGLLGISLIFIGIWGLNRSLLIPFLRPGHRLVDQLAEYRRRTRGPKVVVIGGGHGISTVLRGMKEYTHNLTAVVSVADDGGSSGKLRRTLGILPPGDIRNCLAALSDDETLLTQLFQYRFGEDTGLGGHSFGNLFISAMADLAGNMEEAIVESGRVLSVHGQVLPSTLHDVRLVADVRLPKTRDDVRVEGESKIPKISGQVRRVWLEPNDAPAFPPVIQAVLSADMVIIGPGSLYTSILPNILVRDLMVAIQSSRAIKIFISNVASQLGETDHYACYDHVQALEEFLSQDAIDIIVCNSYYEGNLGQGIDWVRIDERMKGDRRVYCHDLIDRDHPWRHDAVKLAQVIMDLFSERTGPLVKESSIQSH